MKLMPMYDAYVGGQSARRHFSLSHGIYKLFFRTLRILALANDDRRGNFVLAAYALDLTYRLRLVVLDTDIKTVETR